MQMTLLPRPRFTARQARSWSTEVAWSPGGQVHFFDAPRGRGVVALNDTTPGHPRQWAARPLGDGQWQWSPLFCPDADGDVTVLVHGEPSASVPRVVPAFVDGFRAFDLLPWDGKHITDKEKVLVERAASGVLGEQPINRGGRLQ